MTIKANDVRSPKQKRAQDRVDVILTTARLIIERDGMSALSMKGVAREAQISMSSIYQYFPDKAAIVAELCRQVLDANSQTIENALTPSPDTLSDLLNICIELLRIYYRLLQDEPVLRATWFNRSNIPDLLQIEDADSLRNLDILRDRARVNVASDDWPRVQLTLDVLFEMATRGIEAAVKATDYEGDEMLRELEAIVRVIWTERIESTLKKP